MHPKLKFFCELSTSNLQTLMQDGTVIADLQGLNAGICLGLIDFSKDRAQIIYRLNTAGIPVTAWILNPEEHGYWSNVDNASLTAKRYCQFRDWAISNEITFDAVGIQLLPDISNIRSLVNKDIRASGEIILRVLKPGQLIKAKRIYKELASKIRADGYQLETYQIPFIIDERLVKSTIFQKVFRIIDIPADREVLMFYSSLIRPWGLGLMWCYGRYSESVAIGTIGGKKAFKEFGSLSLDWEEFELNFRHAWYLSDSVYIDNLEGCIQQNIFEKISSIELDKTILEPNELIEKIERGRISLQLFLWGLTYLPYIAIIGVISIILLRFHRKRK